MWKQEIGNRCGAIMSARTLHVLRLNKQPDEVSDMAEPAKALENDGDSALEYTDDEMPTNNLNSGHLESRPALYIISNKSSDGDGDEGSASAGVQIDWVAKLAT